MVEEPVHHSSSARYPRLRHAAVLCLKLALPVATCFGLTILVFLCGPLGLVGCLAFLATRNLVLVYGLSLGFAIAWVVASLLLDGIHLGSVEFRPHDSLRIGNLPPLPMNLLASLLFAVLGIKIGYAYRDTCRRAQNRVRDLEKARWKQATPG